MTKPGRKPESEDDLPPERARAQKAREEELLGLVGLARLTERERLLRDIEALAGLVRSNLTALKTSKLTPEGRLQLLRQIQERREKLSNLRRDLETL